jgi:16S rRNA (cytosine1402-N4)-methyltransferase
MDSLSQPNSEHVPVLVEALAQAIRIPEGGLFVDATIGYGGHSRILGQPLGPAGTILGLDVDPGCLERARTALSGLPCRVILERENFANIKDVMARTGVGKADLILADLGWCSGQLEDPRRGFSFQHNMPLDMRLDDRRTTTAADWVNGAEEKELADVIFEYGEERASRRIARAIVEHRRGQKITTTAQLANLVYRTLGRGGKIHPATKTFQALRIVVNDELGSLERLLEAAPSCLKPGGRIAIISFHSLEDRRVKQDFQRNRLEGIYEILTDKPMVPQEDEMRKNPRARSAKMRMAERLP